MDLQQLKLKNLLESPSSQQGTPRFNQGININKELNGISELLLYFNTLENQQELFQHRQSAHLSSLIDLTQFTFVKYEEAQQYQNQMNKLDFAALPMLKSKAIEESVKTQQDQQHSSMVNSFKVYFKTKKPAQQSITLNMYTTRIHNCKKQEVKTKFTVPTRYRSIESHYSPQRLNLYLNKQHPDYSNNNKWLNYGNKKIRSKTNEHVIKLDDLSTTLKPHSPQSTMLISEHHRKLLEQSTRKSPKSSILISERHKKLLDQSQHLTNSSFKQF